MQKKHRRVCLLAAQIVDVGLFCGGLSINAIVKNVTISVRLTNQ